MTVSVVIKTLNEEKNIARTIEFALAALPEGQGEVIIADSGSRDRTVAIASGYPVQIVQITAPARPSCGLGPQLGYQYAQHEYICLIDGDMDLDPEFLAEAIAFLDRHPRTAGVTGHVEEMMLENLEYTRRVQRNAPENRIGSIDRMNGGGLYRRLAIEDIGYMTDRNLHGYEEFDLGIRIRDGGWKLHRLDRRFVNHYGHNVNSYRLLVRRWKSKYLFGIGEVLRAATGKPYLYRMLRELPELRLWAVVWAWIIISLVIMLALRGLLLPSAIVVGIFCAVVGLMSFRKRSFSLGLYTVVAWFFHAVALPVGYLRPRRNPRSWIESRPVGEPDEELSAQPDNASGPDVVGTGRVSG